MNESGQKTPDEQNLVDFTSDTSEDGSNISVKGNVSDIGISP